MSAKLQLHGRSATLLGFGRSNQALLEFLLPFGMRLSIREQEEKDLHAYAARGITLHTGAGYLENLTEDLIFRTPGVRPDLPPLLAAQARGAKISGEYDLFASLCPATLLGITGSDGKTTTTTLCGRLLRKAGLAAYVGGNIGHPLICDLPAMRTGDLAVAELSSFQLMTAPHPPARAVITNISENHLNWHRDMAEYIQAKERILGPKTHAVLNADDPLTAALALYRTDKTLFSVRRTHAALLSAFSPCHTVTREAGWICYDAQPLCPVTDICLPGIHNAANLLAAIGLVFPYLPSATVVGEVARSFTGVPHRLELLGKAKGVCYYNSSIDSTPTRTAAALSALGLRPLVLCGGRSKGLSFAPLRTALATHAKAVLLFGEARAEIVEALHGLSLPITQYQTMQEACAAAHAMAVPGDSILLSPACTSFDEFQDFEARGDAFRRAFLTYQTTGE